MSCSFCIRLNLNLGQFLWFTWQTLCSILINVFNLFNMYELYEVLNKLLFMKICIKQQKNKMERTILDKMFLHFQVSPSRCIINRWSYVSPSKQKKMAFLFQETSNVGMIWKLLNKCKMWGQSDLFFFLLKCFRWVLCLKSKVVMMNVHFGLDF